MFGIKLIIGNIVLVVKENQAWILNSILMLL